MSTDRVMLLIDADNVSADIIEQAVSLLLAEHGALHVRRAYCTAESAVQNQALFKRLQIKPMVNLAAGKNSTDIALAVDAIDLVLAERPEVVVIASSDSDFAPLVARLREKGCRVLGIGQDGKTGDETQAVYDDYTVLAHRKATPAAKTAKAAARTAARPARKTAAKTAASPAAASAAAPAAAAPAATAPASTAKAPAKRAPRPKAEPAVAAAAPAAVQAAAPAMPPAAAPAPRPAPAPAPNRAPALPDKVQQILQALPELAQGEAVGLQQAGERLRRAQLLSKRGSSTKLFTQFMQHFELLPRDKPVRVMLLAATRR